MEQFFEQRDSNISRGTQRALLLAAEHPERVLGAVLVGPWFPASRSYDPSLVFLYFVNPAAAMSLFPVGVFTCGAQITRSTGSPVSG